MAVTRPIHQPGGTGHDIFAPGHPHRASGSRTLAAVLDRRSASRLVWLFLGAVLARGRTDRHQLDPRRRRSAAVPRCYTTVAAAGKKAELDRRPFGPRGGQATDRRRPRITLAMDDTPTQRYGPLGPGGRHPSQPDPRAGRLAARLRPHLGGARAAGVHPAWGVIALPLLARLYVRAKDLPGIDPEHRPEFRTKLELAVELLRWASSWLASLGKPLWVVVDGAYAKAPFLKPAMALGMTVVSRLRKDAALWTVPGPRSPGGGAGRGSTARAASSWPSGPGSAGVDDRQLRPVRQATVGSGTRRSWRPGGRPAGVIRVVLVAEPTGWVAFFCTDVTASVDDDPGDASPTGSRLETAFRDCQGGRRGRPTTGAVLVGEHRCVPRLPVDVHDDRGLGLGPVRGGIGGPRRSRRGMIRELAVRAMPTSAGVAARIAGRRNSSGSPPRDDRGGNSGGRRAATRPGRMMVGKSRKVQTSTRAG